MRIKKGNEMRIPCEKTTFLLLCMIMTNLIMVGGYKSTFSINQDATDILLDNSLYQSAPRDSFTIMSLFLDGDILTINITYGGGCEDHIFRLIGSNEYLASSPAQTYVLLSHDANNDSCEALLWETLEFNLVPLAWKYQEFHKADSETIRIHIIGGLENVTINYTFTLNETTITNNQITNIEVWPFLLSLAFFGALKRNSKKECFA